MRRTWTACSNSATGPARRRGAAKPKRAASCSGSALPITSRCSIGTPKERADLIVAPDDGIEVVIGTQPAGQGHETSFAQVMADLLGVPFEQVTITLGDTDVVTAGGGTHSGRSMRHASAVIALAVEDLIEKAKAHAGEILETSTADRSTFEDGLFRAPATNRTLELVRTGAARPRACLPDMRGGLHVRRDNEMHPPVFPNGACMCEIEIDPDTGGD